MKLPRDVSGLDLAKLLRKFGYEVTRQKGSHIRLTSFVRGRPHHITVPSHKSLKIGTLSAILSDVASYIEMERSRVEEELFSE